VILRVSRSPRSSQPRSSPGTGSRCARWRRGADTRPVASQHRGLRVRGGL